MTYYRLDKLDCAEFIVNWERYRVFSLKGEPVLVQQLSESSIKDDPLWREIEGSNYREFVIHHWHDHLKQGDLFRKESTCPPPRLGNLQAIPPDATVVRFRKPKHAK